MPKPEEKRRSIFDLGPNIEVVFKGDLATYLANPDGGLYALAQTLALNELPAKPADQTLDDYVFATMSDNLRVTAGLKVVCFGADFQNQNKAGEDLTIEQVLEHIHAQILKAAQAIEAKATANPLHRKDQNFEVRFSVNRSLDARRIQIFVYAVDSKAPDQIPESRMQEIFQPMYLVEQAIVEHAYTAEDIFNLLVDRTDVKLSVTYQPDVMAGQNYFKVDQRGNQEQPVWLDQVKAQLWPLHTYEFQEIPVNKDKTRRFLVTDPAHCNAAGDAQIIATVELTFVRQNQPVQPAKSIEAKPAGEAVKDAATSTETVVIPAELLNSLNRWSTDKGLKAEKYHPVLKKLLSQNVTSQDIRDYFNALQVGKLNMLKQFESALILRTKGMNQVDIVKAMAAGTDLATLI